MTWNELLRTEMERHGDQWGSIVKTSVKHVNLDAQATWSPFYVWTKNRVYFPEKMSKILRVTSVPRNPE